jgi:3-hydroxyisobutyrate dehydrogenase-like beta-hydroxyacid dehydrogenase
MNETIGFIGLGGMGSAMAANVLKTGIQMRVYDRTSEKAKPLVHLGAAPAETPAGVAETGGIVVTMLTNDQAVEEVAFGENGFGDALRPSGPLLDAMGQGVHDFGEDTGAANVVKLTGNFLLGAAIEAMVKAFTLAQKTVSRARRSMSCSAAPCSPAPFIRTTAN